MTMQRLTLAITGMTCASCVSRIEQALRARDGIVWADVNFAAQQATVTYDPRAIVPAQVAELVRRLGYETTHPADGNGAGPSVAPAAQIAQRTPDVVVPALAGLAASLLLVGLYLGLVTAVQDWKHARELLWDDRWLVGAIAAGFGMQIGLYVYLRRLKALHHRLGHCKAVTAAGTGSSSVAMLACCAHHLTDVLPLIGLTAAATFLNQYRVPFMLAGIGTNPAGIILMVRLIRWQRQEVDAIGG